ncbi:glycoside hydrolase family protein [Clostridium aquiflavi]|uniref:Lysozyme n=1 Tax=Clostridium aquiflavi TaxID=3073603 RepID=A0ABU1EGM7_9CLOT|nr:glycoside hydrolase family protein [Clostridium sp. 5N-1]MDR5587428.1 glycoside hydrolase family protein [Clostridium sp. 5N-1]
MKGNDVQMLDWKEKNGEWFCYKAGTLVKGWVEDENGRWFHLNERNGKMDIDWVEIDSIWYYFYPKKTEKDGNTHYTGEMATGWIEIDSKWYYLYSKRTEKDGITHPKGEMAAGWAEIDSRWYYFYSKRTEKDGITYPKGEMATGWIEIDSRWYFLYPNKTEKYGVTHPQGEMATDWTEINSKWYYLYTKKTEKDGNTHYTGEMATGWIKLNEKWYYLYSDGKMACNTTIDGWSIDSNGVANNSAVSGDGLVSTNCINFVKGYEQFHAHKYDDGTGTITQGYGCIKDEIADWGDTITEQQASDRLNNLINAKYAKPVKANLDSKGISLTQNQFDSLVSFAYNIGYPTLFKSSLYNYIVSGGRDADTIKRYFCMYNKGMVNGVLTVMDGLNKRRIAESNIFNYGIYDSTH